MSSVDTTTDAEATDEGRILDITEAAVTKVLEIRNDEDEPETMALEVRISGIQAVEYVYELSFVALDEAETDAVVYRIDQLPVIVPADTVDDLRGATLDLPSSPVQGGLVIRNPNRPPMLGEGELEELELSGTVEERLDQLLRLRINPALASHGGWASLVSVDEPAAVVTMGGGCQGCAMSAATLREGISAMILEAIPEITEVRDATDHTAGETPYYS